MVIKNSRLIEMCRVEVDNKKMRRCVPPHLELSALQGAMPSVRVLSVFAGLEWMCVPDEVFGW